MYYVMEEIADELLPHYADIHVPVLSDRFNMELRCFCNDYQLKAQEIRTGKLMQALFHTKRTEGKRSAQKCIYAIIRTF